MSQAELPPTPALVVQDLTLRYGQVEVLSGLNLVLPVGAVVGLIGRNGAGKSTLMRSMLGLSLPQTGRIELLGEPAANLSDATRERIGYVPQLPDLVEWMTVSQHAAYIGSFYARWTESRARDLFNRFELKPGLLVKDLSVGDKQKLSIVLALAHDPELVLMDEPVASLDPLMRREFMRALFDTQQQRTVVLSSHLLSDLERVVSCAAFLRNGRLQLFGGWDELVENLRIVQRFEAFPEQAGLVAQRRTDIGWSAVLDTRFASQARHLDGPSTLTLDDLFVELNT